MKNEPAIGKIFDDQESGPPASSSNAEAVDPRSISAVAPTDWQQLNVAIDVVASLAEQASRKLITALASFQCPTLDATFAYMVEYLHRLTIDQDTPRAALAKAATASAYDMDALRALRRAWAPTMDEKSPSIDALLAAYEAALAEERMLWRSINDLKRPTDRLMAYARWRAASERVKVLANRLHAAE